MDLATVAQSDFSAHVGSSFSVTTSKGDVAVELKTVETLGGGKAGGRAPFSLVFVGPMSAVVQQGTYKVSHSVLGSAELFLVPIGPGLSGMRYEAIFG